MVSFFANGWLGGFRNRLRGDLATVEKYIRHDLADASPRLSPFEQMVIVLEDRRFLRHAGVDIQSIIRELYKMILRRKHGGASTIEHGVAIVRELRIVNVRV